MDRDRIGETIFRSARIACWCDKNDDVGYGLEVDCCIVFCQPIQFVEESCGMNAKLFPFGALDQLQLDYYAPPQ